MLYFTGGFYTQCNGSKEIAFSLTKKQMAKYI